jgi:hypothetical protein
VTTTSAQRRRKGAAKKKRWRERYYKLGLKRMELWAHPDDVADVKHFAETLLRARGIHVEHPPPDTPASGEPPYS